MSSHCVVNNIEIKSLSIQTQLISIYYMFQPILVHPHGTVLATKT